MKQDSVKFNLLHNTYLLIIIHQGRDTEDIVEDLARDFSRGIELTCRCSIPSDYIADGRLTCQNQNLIYQGRIISTDDRDSTSLLADLQEWLSSFPVIIAQGEELKLVKNEPEPSIETAKQEDSPTEGFPVSTVGVTAGAAAILVLLVIVVAGTVVACRRKR